MDGGERSRERRLCNSGEDRGVVWRAETRHVRLQPRGQLGQHLYVEILALQVFCDGFWDEVELLSQFQAAEERPQQEQAPDGEAKDWHASIHEHRTSLVHDPGSVKPGRVKNRSSDWCTNPLWDAALGGTSGVSKINSFRTTSRKNGLSPSLCVERRDCVHTLNNSTRNLICIAA